MNMDEALQILRRKYTELGFIEVALAPGTITFNKQYAFEDSDKKQMVADMIVEYNKLALLRPPMVYDKRKTLISMHSNGLQCWARFEDIYTQAGIGLIEPSLIEQQILRLIEAHIKTEYETVNESPEFTYAFEQGKMIDHSPFFISPNVIDKVASLTEDKQIISCLANPFGEGYQVVNADLSVSSNSQIILPNPSGQHRRVYFLRTSVIPHFDSRISAEEFLYSLELHANIEPAKCYLQNLNGEFYIVVLFPNVPFGKNDIIVWKKNGKSLKLLPHARIADSRVYFSRNLEEYNLLSIKSIGIVGLGAIGSLLGLNLLQSGIKELIIIDNDWVDYENLNRSIYLGEHIGKRKTEAFISIAKKKLPFTNNVKELESIDFLFSQDYLDKLDLLIICIGDVYQEYLLSRLLRSKGFERSVFVFGQNDCTWGGAYFQDHKQLGCQQCLFLHQQKNKDLLMPYIRKSTPAVGCGNPSYVGSISDISTIAGIAGKLITRRLTGDKGIKLPNFYIWQSSPEYLARKDTHPDPFSLQQFRVEQHNDCDCKNF